VIELAEYRTPIALLLTIGAGCVAFVLIFDDRPGRLVVPLVALAIVLAADVWWIAFYAQGLDGYFADETTRWDFAARSGSESWVVAAAAVASASVTLLLLSAFVRSSLARISLLSASVSSFMLVFGWFVLTVGH
jgi:hypothetical protein